MPYPVQRQKGQRPPCGFSSPRRNVRELRRVGDTYGCELGAHESHGQSIRDQQLKTAVALIELHKVRYGEYPDSIGDLKFIGQWDRSALQNLAYYSNPDRTAYYLEARRSWIGKPDLEMPPEFWKGTGYDPTLKPATQ
jgi:hypothetical protein